MIYALKAGRKGGMKEIEEKVIPVTEAAEEKDCSRQTIHNAVDRGDLNEVRAGHYVLIVRDEKYEAFQVQETGGRMHESYLQKRHGTVDEE